MTAITFSDHYSGRYGCYVQERRIAGTQGIAMFEMLQPAGDFSDPAVSDFVVIETRSSLRGDWDFGAGRIRSSEARQVFVVPPDCPTNIVIDDWHLFRAFSVSPVPMQLDIADCFGGTPPDFALLQQRGTRSPLIVELLERLWASGMQPSATGRLLADSAFLTLFAELVREAATRVAPARGGLSPHQLRRVQDFVEARLESDISLAELAHEAGFSAFHFARCFKRSLGITPFQYLTMRRVAHAQRLLQTTQLSLADIALACGFADQSSFTTAFGRQIGLTPARWRRQTIT